MEATRTLTLGRLVSGEIERPGRLGHDAVSPVAVASPGLGRGPIEPNEDRSYRINRLGASRIQHLMTWRSMRIKNTSKKNKRKNKLQRLTRLVGRKMTLFKLGCGCHGTLPFETRSNL